ncbi:Cold shock domain-containing protein C2 [Merluccius polli]|uniref:Cold shock domain-containing protein C2 n=1 Tax=Merluccius polli TaxID=89951 RepID=A0AA47MKK9_MERPO|nr:Cold shock domain-containing protein C2 [Merluccius polli]
MSHMLFISTGTRGLVEITQLCRSLTGTRGEARRKPSASTTTTATVTGQLDPIQHPRDMADPRLTSPSQPPLRSPGARLSLSFPFLREGSRVWEDGVERPLPRQLPSPLPTKRTRTYSATVRAQSGPVFKGVCKNFSRSQGHGFLRPSHGGEDIFVHISDIEGEYVPVEGDEVTYKVSRVPPKNLKVQAVEVKITHLNPGTKHETWSGQIMSS